MNAGWFVPLSLLLAVRAGSSAETPPPADVIIRVEPHQAEIRARNVAIDEILDAVAASQEITVHYDGPRPRRRLTVSVVAPRMAEALGLLLARERLKYGLSSDPHSGRVRGLVIVTRGTAPQPPPRPSPEPTPPVGWRPDPVATIDEPPLPDHPSPPDK